MKHYKAAFLDFYGTLVKSDDELIARVTRRIVDLSHAPCDERRVMADWPFAEYCARAFGCDFKLQREIEREAVAHMFSKYRVGLDADEVCEELFAHWVAPEPYEDSFELLEGLLIPVCIASNIDNGDLLRAVEFAGYQVRHIVTSEDCRSYKPRPEVFLSALKLMQCRPGEVLHVGDSLNADVTGARSLGIDVAWVNRNGRMLQIGEPEPTYTVKSLREVLSLVGD